MFERSPRASHTLFSLSFPSCLLFSPSVSLFFQIDKTNPDLPFPQILSARTFPQHSLQSLPVPTSFFMLDKMNQPESTKKNRGGFDPRTSRNMCALEFDSRLSVVSGTEGWIKKKCVRKDRTMHSPTFGTYVQCIPFPASLGKKGNYTQIPHISRMLRVTLGLPSLVESSKCYQNYYTFFINV